MHNHLRREKFHVLSRICGRAGREQGGISSALYNLDSWDLGASERRAVQGRSATAQASRAGARREREGKRSGAEKLCNVCAKVDKIFCNSNTNNCLGRGVLPRLLTGIGQSQVGLQKLIPRTRKQIRRSIVFLRTLRRERAAAVAVLARDVANISQQQNVLKF